MSEEKAAERELGPKDVIFIIAVAAGVVIILATWLEGFTSL